MFDTLLFANYQIEAKDRGKRIQTFYRFLEFTQWAINMIDVRVRQQCSTHFTEHEISYMTVRHYVQVKNQQNLEKYLLQIKG